MKAEDEFEFEFDYGNEDITLNRYRHEVPG
jgi:hypothetical protein